MKLAPIRDENIEYQETVTISPDMAKEWLEKYGNTKNRIIRQPWVHSLVEMMVAGRWDVSGEFAISFGRSGRLLNGHHRLHAIVAYGHPFTFIIRRNVDEGALRYIDTQRNRTRRNIGQMFDIDVSQDDALRLIDIAYRGHKAVVSDLRLESMRQQLSDAIGLVATHADARWRRRRLRAGVRGGLIVIARVDEVNAPAFFRTIEPVCLRLKSDPRATVNMVNWMEDHGSAGNQAQIEHLAMTLNAYQQFLAGSELKAVRSDGLSSDRSFARSMIAKLKLQ
jgi:hypothetical protein